MTQSEILQKAIEKAKKNGFKIEYLIPSELTYDPAIYIINNRGLKNLNIGYVLSVKDIIFSQDFAKAFWGDEVVCSECGSEAPLSDIPEERCECLFKNRVKREYEYHLQNIALEENPILYLKSFLL